MARLIEISTCKITQEVRKYLRFGANPNEFKNKVSYWLCAVRVGAVGEPAACGLRPSEKHVHNYGVDDVAF